MLSAVCRNHFPSSSNINWTTFPMIQSLPISLTTLDALI